MVGTATLRRLLLILPVALACPNVHAATLLARWNFEEGAGSTAVDSSGSGRSGAISGGASREAGGPVGSYALALDGWSGSVYVPDDASNWLSPGSLAISLWFRLDANQYGDYVDILDKGHGHGSNPYNAGYAIQSGQYSRAFGAFQGNGGTFVGLETPTISDTGWHHLAVNLGTGGLSLWLDGSLMASASSAGAILDNDSGLFLGRHRALGRYLHGALDDVRLYSGSFTQTDVDALYSGVPEPGTLLLLGTGLAGLAGALRRRKAG